MVDSRDSGGSQSNLAVSLVSIYYYYYYKVSKVFHCSIPLSLLVQLVFPDTLELKFMANGDTPQAICQSSPSPCFHHPPPSLPRTLPHLFLSAVVLASQATNQPRHRVLSGKRDFHTRRYSITSSLRSVIHVSNQKLLTELLLN